MIFCVEGEKTVRELIIYTLNNSGLESVGIETAQELFSRVKSEIPTLILLAADLPDKDGIEVLVSLRQKKATSDIPIILLSSKGNEIDKVIGLDSGADDYVTKPLGMMELIARIKALMRRVKRGQEKSELRYQDIVLDLPSHTVRVDSKPVDLTLKEYRLLAFLIENAGNVLTRDMLLESIWSYDFDGETRTVDAHVKSLRKKLGKSGSAIQTVRGVGYRLGGPGGKYSL